MPIREWNSMQDAYDNGFEDGKNEPVTGADVTDGASEEPESCGCGEPITFYRGGWLHVYNPALRGTGDHDAEPGEGYYEPGEEEEPWEEEEDDA